MSAEIHQAVVDYMERGVAVIPAIGKRPIHDDWQNLRLTKEDVPEALEVVGRLLPPTLTSGRASRPHCHWWYQSEGIHTEKFKDGGGAVLLELRSSGAQTLVEPSTHPSGERYAWHRESGLGMARVEATELKRRLRDLATAVLMPATCRRSGTTAPARAGAQKR